jgi:hypothetical protein
MPTGESLAIAPATSQAQVNELEREAQRLGLQLQRLAAALADGDDLPSVLAVLREKEARRGTIQGQIEALQRGTSSLSLLADFEKVQGESSTGSTTGAGCCRGRLGRPDEWCGRCSTVAWCSRPARRRNSARIPAAVTTMIC